MSELSLTTTAAKLESDCIWVTISENAFTISVKLGFVDFYAA